MEVRGGKFLVRNGDGDFEEVELRDCPFCGKRPVLGLSSAPDYVDEEGNYRNGEYYIKVKCDCGVQTALYKKSAMAIQAWNNRTVQQ